MSDMKALYELYLSLREEIREIEEALVKHTNVLFAQTRAILIAKDKVNMLIAEYHKILGTSSPDVIPNKEYDRRLEEVTDIIVSKQKYKM